MDQTRFDEWPWHGSMSTKTLASHAIRSRQKSPAAAEAENDQDEPKIGRRIANRTFDESLQQRIIFAPPGPKGG